MVRKRIIEDFGEKIGGARKDLYTNRQGLSLQDIIQMNDLELSELKVKESTWVVGDYKEYCDVHSLDTVVVYYIRAIRNSIPSKVKLRGYNFKSFKVVIAIYSEAIKQVRDLVLKYAKNIKSDDINLDNQISVHVFYEKLMGEFAKSYSTYDFRYITERVIEVQDKLRNEEGCSNLVTIDMVELFVYFLKMIEKEISKRILSGAGGGENLVYKAKLNNFPYALSGNIEKLIIRTYANTTGFYVTSNFKSIKSIIRREYDTFNNGKFNTFKDMQVAIGKLDKLVEIYKDGIKKSGEKEKLKLIRPQLSHIDRFGPTVGGDSVETDDILNIFKFRGGEFGNWNSQSDRKAIIGHVFDSLADLAYIINVPLSFMSISDDPMRLAIAFGARGVGRAVAHYEPARHVINLTKMSGAGSLAHEWAHALDRSLATLLKLNSNYLSEYNNTQDENKLAKQMIQVVRTMKTIPIECKSECKHMVDLNSRDKLLELSMLRKDKLIRMLRSEHERLEIESDSSVEGDKLNKLDKILSKHKEYLLRIESSEEDIKEIEGIMDEVRCLGLDNTKLSDLVLSMFRDIQVNYKNRLRIKLDIDKGNYTGSVSTLYFRYSKMFDMGKRKNYYSTQQEMFARAFESVIEYKLKNKGLKSQYLVHSTQNQYIELNNETVSPYPYGEELERISIEIDKLIDIIKEIYSLGENELSGLYKSKDTYIAYSTERSKVKKKVNESIEREKDEQLGNKDSKGIQDNSLRGLLVSVYGNNTTRNGLDKDIINQSISKYIEIGKRLRLHDIGLIDFGVKRIVGDGNSKAFILKNKNDKIILCVDGRLKREKQLEGLIEGVVSWVVYSRYGRSRDSEMIVEGITYMICKGIGLDVRTYCLSDAYKVLEDDVEQKKSYINICKKICTALHK